VEGEGRSPKQQGKIYLSPVPFVKPKNETTRREGDPVHSWKERGDAPRSKSGRTTYLDWGIDQASLTSDLAAVKKQTKI